MPLVSPATYDSSPGYQYAVGTIPPPLLNPIPVETGLASNYVLARQGLRAETGEDIVRYSGELVITQTGDYIVRTVNVATESGVHQLEVVQLNNGGGNENLVPVEVADASKSAAEKAAEAERKKAEDAYYASLEQAGTTYGGQDAATVEANNAAANANAPPIPQAETGSTPSDSYAPPETSQPVGQSAPPPVETVGPSGCTTYTETWWDEATGQYITVYIHDNGSGSNTVYV